MGKHLTVYLSLGGNIGDRSAYLAKAQQLLIAQIGPLVKASSIYETESWGREDLDPFLNQVIALKTDQSPQELMKTCMEIENLLGRRRIQHWGNRSIDIDILLYGDEIIHDSDLEIPHARLHQRNFVLIPLLEIAAELIHPVFQKNIQSLYQVVEDPLAVVRKS